MIRSKSIRSFAGVTVALLLLASCTGDDGSPETVRSPVASPTLDTGRIIALVGTMSGPGSWRGTEAFEGADLGVARLNRQLTDGELPYELVTLDDEGDPERATELIEAQAANPRTVGVIHAGAAQALPPTDDVLAEAGIPAFLIFGDLYSARLLRPNLFQMSPPFLWQARRVAAYLGRDRNYDLVGIVTDRSLSGDAAVSAAKAAIADEGDLRALSRRYADVEDIAEALDDFEEAKVEALVFQGDPSTFGELLADIRKRRSSYRGTRAARWASLTNAQRQRARGKTWRPQIVAFDEAMEQADTSDPPPGTIVAESYTRGADYLPIPSFRSFRDAFEAWWASPPSGPELRAYDAVRMIGWAAERTDDGEDLVATLEKLEAERFGGLDVTFGPDDHVAPGMTHIGLWTIPASSAQVRGPRREGSPWAPLARGFSTDGRRTDILPHDWKHLFRDAPPQTAPAPSYRKMRFGIVSGRSDPLH